MGNNLPRPFADYLKEGIYELRVKLSGDETRTLYFFCFEEYIILTHCFLKKTDRIPKTEIKRALKYKDDFLRRYDKNTIKDFIR